MDILFIYYSDYKIVAMDGIPSEFLQERAQKRLKGLLEQYGQQVASGDDEDDDDDDGGNNLVVANGSSLPTASASTTKDIIKKANVTSVGNGVDNTAKFDSTTTLLELPKTAVKTDEGNRSSMNQSKNSLTGRTQMVTLEDGSRLFYGEDSISPEERRLSDILNNGTLN